jgi:ferredoxin-NADP reductase
MLSESGFAPEERPRIFVCGPTGFVEGVADDLTRLGHDPVRVRTERFGATGG